MPKLIPPVLSVLDLPAAELCAARLDGEIFCIGDGYAPVDASDDARHRALSVSLSVPQRLVAERRTAAWIHGALCAPPTSQEFCVDIESRYRVVGASGYSTREVVFAVGDITVIGNLQVTTCRRTVIDLLRRVGPLIESDARAIVSLAQVAGFSLEDIRIELSARHHLPGKRAVMCKLESLLNELANR